ncbi:hypothetical protein HKD37_U058084 [Glycine soja]
MTGPLDESISCFLLKVDPWVLVPITVRGLYVLAIRGLHILAYRGLHALAFRRQRVLVFSVLHIHTLREYKMTLLFSNILPSDHNANLPLQMYRDRAHKTPSGPEEVQQGPGVSSSGYGSLNRTHKDTQWTRRSPTGPWGFQLWLRASIVLQGSRLQDTQWTRRGPTGSWSCQALITSLCQFYGVSVTSSKGIRPLTNRAFIKKYCVPRQAQGETPQQPGDGRQRATDTPPSPLEFTSAHPQKG